MKPDDARRDGIIRAWLGEPAYLPESGFERLMQTVRTTPQQRPTIRDIGTRRTLSMFTERWCELPPVVLYAGPDGELRIRDDGSLAIGVRDLEPRPYREQPENGWGCPTSNDELIAMLSALMKERPAGWTDPAVIAEAMAERRFDDVRSATLVALRVVRAAGAVEEALPRSGYLERLRPRFEGADTIARLEELAAQAQADTFDARRAHELHERLDAEVGHWTMPVAITRPLDKGRLQDAVAVMEDALAIIQSVAGAGDGRLDDIRSRFEATGTPAEIADLRAELEALPSGPLESPGQP